MPRKILEIKKSHGSRRKTTNLLDPRRQMERVSHFAGRYGAVISDGTFLVLPMAPLLWDDRLAAEAQLYMQYRFTSLKVHYASNSNLFVMCGAELNVGQSANPSGRESLQDCPWYGEGTGFPGYPYPELKMDNRDLRADGQISWYNTNLTASDEEFEAQGRLYFNSPYSSATNSYILIEYTIEFVAPCDPDIALAKRKRREQVKNSDAWKMIQRPAITNLSIVCACPDEEKFEELDIDTPKGSCDHPVLAGIRPARAKPGQQSSAAIPWPGKSNLANRAPKGAGRP